MNKTSIRKNVEDKISKEKIRDDQLMLLEQLTYLDSDIANLAGISKKDYVEYERKPNLTVDKYLSEFTEEALMKLQNTGKTIGHIQAHEWAAIIRAIKADPTLRDLTISDRFIDSRGNRAALCFTDKNRGNQPIVAFRGTLDGMEWKDNVYALNVADTPAQIEALRYIERLPYKDITVVGHSKGGNKAQYVTIVSDKVSRCLSMDGQGFSREFFYKYGKEIEKKASYIKNFSLNNDFVNQLMFPVPGSKQFYFEGFGMEGFTENHSPNSFFPILFLYRTNRYYEGSLGAFHGTPYAYGMSLVDNRDETFLKYNSTTPATILYENGQIKLRPVSGVTPAMQLEHGFVNFILNVMTDDKKDKVKEYFGDILRLAMSDDTIEFRGKEYNKANLKEYIFADSESLSLTIAYLMKYVDTYGLKKEQIKELVVAFFPNEIVSEIISGIIEQHLNLARNGRKEEEIYLNFKKIVEFMEKDLYQILEKQLFEPLENEYLEAVGKGLDSINDRLLEILLNLEKGNLFFPHILSNVTSSMKLRKKLLKNKSELRMWFEYIGNLMRLIEKEYEEIGEVNAATANKDRGLGVKRNFSKEMYDRLLSIMSSFQAQTFDDAGSWTSYSGEEWYGELSIDAIRNGLQQYADRLIDVNRTCKERIERVYENEWEIDRINAEKVKELIEELKIGTKGYKELAERVAPNVGPISGFGGS